MDFVKYIALIIFILLIAVIACSVCGYISRHAERVIVGVLIIALYLLTVTVSSDIHERLAFGVVAFVLVVYLAVICYARTRGHCSAF